MCPSEMRSTMYIIGLVWTNSSITQSGCNTRNNICTIPFLQNKENTKYMHEMTNRLLCTLEKLFIVLYLDVFLGFERYHYV